MLPTSLSIEWRPIVDGYLNLFIAGEDTGASVGQGQTPSGGSFYVIRPRFEDSTIGNHFSTLEEAQSVAIREVLRLAFAPRESGRDPLLHSFESTVSTHVFHLRVEDLDRVKTVIKIKKLAELAGLSPSAIAQKIGRGTQLSIDESESMTRVLRELGIVIERRKT